MIELTINELTEVSGGCNCWCEDKNKHEVKIGSVKHAYDCPSLCINSNYVRSTRCDYN